MKKINLAIFIIFATMFCGYSQQLKEKVGNNPTIIDPSAVLEIESSDKGVLFPRVALTSSQDITTIASPQVSLLVYNTATAGVYPNDITPGYYYWNGVIWSRFSASAVGTIDSINCVGVTHNGALTIGSAASGVSSSFSYTGGNGGIYTAQSIASTGVTGLTATLSAGILANGSGTLMYSITGTPSTGGTASFAISIGGQTCTLTRTVLPVGTITSINCGGATHSGTLINGSAASSVSSEISYTGGNGGAYTTQSIASTGVTGLTATVSAGTLASGAGTLTYTITGTPSVAGTASFAISIGGQTCTLTRTVFPTGTITAINCGGATHSGTLLSGISSDISSAFSYTGGNGGAYTTQSIASTGVTGLTATLSGGILASGAGTLTYTITGTPSASGTASFAITIGGQTCTLTRTVLPAGTITTINCDGAIHSGTLTSERVASSVSSEISYTGGNGGAYTTQSIASTGVTGLTATLAAGTLASGSGTLTYTITGTPSAAGTASFTIIINGQTCTLVRTIVSIALHCNEATHNGTLKSNVVASGVSSIVSYTGADGAAHTGQTVTSTGVTGLTATLEAGNFAIGEGTLIYTITGTPSSSGTASFAINIGAMSCTLTRTVIDIETLNCAAATHSGTLSYNVVANGVSSVIAYTGGNGTAHTGQTVTSTGVTGLTATLAAGNFANGDATLTYTITGVPTSSGTASFAINIGGLNCTLTRTVTPISSIYDSYEDGLYYYLVEGKLADGVSSVIPYTGGDGSAHTGQTVTSTGVTGLTATLVPGNFATGDGSLTYMITGMPSSSGTASFDISIGGMTYILTITVYPAGTITSINCDNAIHNGALVRNIEAIDVTSVIPYTGGNYGIIVGQTVASTGVTGLTATLAHSIFPVGDGFANGNGTLTYTITGTPSSIGTASFAINIGGQSCTLTRTINDFAFLDYNAFTQQGGVISNGVTLNGVSISIPYTGGNGTAYSGQTITDEFTGSLTATLAPGNFAIGDGMLTYTITGTPYFINPTYPRFVITIGTVTFYIVPSYSEFTTLDCAEATHNGTLTNGVASSGVSSSIPYTRTVLQRYYNQSQSVNSTGVTGLTATINLGLLAYGPGSLTYTITGTPSSAGTASFNIEQLGMTCTLTRTVLPVGTITDLNCGDATHNGTLTASGAASDVSSVIAYTGGNGGTYTAQSIASMGVTGLTARLSAGTLASGTGTLMYTITGTPSAAGTASFAIIVGGRACVFTRTVN